MNLVIDALGGDKDGGVEVVSGELEFPVSTITWMHRGARVRLVKPVEGELRADDVLEAAGGGESVICLSHVQYSNGFRADLEEIGRRKGQHPFVVNAAQSAGAFQIDVKRMGIDALCSTGHKWMLSGYGSGFVYMSRELLERTRPRSIGWLSVENPFAMRNSEFVVRGGAAPRAEMGCPHFAGIFAISAAADYFQQLGTERIERRVLALNRHLTERLDAAGWRVLSPTAREQSRSGETLVGSDEPRRTVAHLARRGVAVTLKPEGIRVATHFFNDETDIDRLIDALGELRRN
jgi:selenocysteine lyase/cysteine desulfurase